jgi:hypothetical protein
VCEEQLSISFKGGAVMKRKLIVVLITVMVCAGVAGGVVAQSRGPNAPDAVITTKFTHQGQLKRNGALFNGTCAMRFTLWDAATAGVQQASYTVPAPVNVSEGVFAVEVDFGAQFKGEARWIQTETQCADDASYQNLPRVALNPTPYAIGLMPGAQSIGSLSGTGGIMRAVNTGQGAALVGLATSATGTTYGVLGNAFSPNGYAVLGYANGGAIGVRGVSDSTGQGVWGESQAGEGVRGTAHNPDHAGVVGVNDGGGFGVYGLSTTQSGVVGESTSGVGVYGKSTTSAGIIGETAVAHTYNTPGVYGKSTGNGGIGVIGEANIGNGYGVYGLSAAGAGVVGQSTTGYAGYFIGKVGITGADLAERFAATDDQPIEPGTVVVIDEDQPGKIRTSIRAYDNQVIGIISGAGGIDPALILHQDGALEGDLVVAIAGRVNCKAEADSAPIKPGDLLTTSSVPGRCMKVTDRDQAYGAVIGKALTGLDKGEGLVLVLVNLQ